MQIENFKIIYRILNILEKAMDYDEFDMNSISAETMKISEARWIKLMMLLSKEGYIDGVIIKQSLDGEYVMSVRSPQITLKGLEYLEENSLMKKAAKLAKGIAEII